jgi:hypothetical protein
MRRTLFATFICVGCLSCCGDAEKLPVPPLPLDGAALPYSQVVSRLSSQTNAAKDEHFLNRWDGVIEVSVGLEQTASYLLRSPDLPTSHKPKIEKTSTELNSNILKLREAARRKDQTESLELIRRIHNQVKDLQELK